MDINLLEIGRKVRELMDKYDVNKAQLAKYMEIKEQELSKMLEGKKEFSIDNILKITQFFDLNIEECVKTFFS